MKYILLVAVLGISSLSYSQVVSLGNDQVDVLESKVASNPSRLEELTKTLAEGSYANLDDLDGIRETKVLNNEGATSYNLKAWNLNCKKDRFNGSKRCFLFKHYDGLMVSIIDGVESVFVGSKHYPRSQSAIKIDNNSAHYGFEGSIKNSKLAINQMKIGKIAYTRYREWPHDFNRDGEVDLSGFKEQYEHMMLEYKKL